VAYWKHGTWFFDCVMSAGRDIVVLFQETIKGVMMWKNLPSPAITSTTNAPTLCNVWVPRRFVFSAVLYCMSNFCLHACFERTQSFRLVLKQLVNCLLQILETCY